MRPFIYKFFVVSLAFISHAYASNGNNILLQVSSSLEATSISSWQANSPDITFSSTPGSDIEFFNAYNFTLAYDTAISFSTLVAKTFSPLKMNLFNGYIDTNTTAGDLTLNVVASPYFLKINSQGTVLEPGHNNQLYQQSIGNDFSEYCLTLIAGDYSLTLSGIPNSSGNKTPAYTLSSFDLDSNCCSPASAVPESSPYAMMLIGLGLLGFMTARRRKLRI